MSLEHTADAPGAEIVAGSESVAPPPGLAVPAEPRSPRRRWSPEEKRSLAEMTLQPGATVPEVAETFGVAQSQLYCWRRQLTDGELEPVTPSFALVEVAAPAEVPSADSADEPGRIEVIFPTGVRVTVDGQVNAVMLDRVLAALGR